MFQSDVSAHIQFEFGGYNCGQDIRILQMILIQNKQNNSFI